MKILILTIAWAGIYFLFLFIEWLLKPTNISPFHIIGVIAIYYVLKKYFYEKN